MASTTLFSSQSSEKKSLPVAQGVPFLDIDAL